jgi:hypothetical protein
MFKRWRTWNYLDFEKTGINLETPDYPCFEIFTNTDLKKQVSGNL